MSATCKDQRPGDEAQSHFALFYEDDLDYLDGIMRFIEPALAAGEPVAAAVPPDRAILLRTHLNGSAERVELLDIFELGRNPARIIPEVERMRARFDGARLHWVGEPIWAGRSEQEIQEATRHEALVNLAWPDVPISVLCAYDAVALHPDVLADAKRTHPWVIRRGRRMRSDAYRGPVIPQRCEAPLPAPPPHAHSIRFTTDGLSRLRALVADVARRAGLSQDRTTDLMLVASELGTNAIRHGHGSGTVHAWSSDDKVTFQVQDRGRIADPLAGRRPPRPMAAGGVGLWMVNQLCDLVEARTGEDGTTVRAHVCLS